MITGNISLYNTRGAWLNTQLGGYAYSSSEYGIAVGIDTYGKHRIYAKSNNSIGTATVAKVFIVIGGYLKGDEGKFAICCPNTEYTGNSAQELYTYCGQATEITYTASKWNNTGATIEVSNSTYASRILKYGIVLREKSGVEEYNLIDSFTINAMYYNADSAADIRVITSDGADGKWKFPEDALSVNGNVYWEQRIDRDMRIAWECLQPMSNQTKYEIALRKLNSTENITVASGTTETSAIISRKKIQELLTEDKKTNFTVCIRVDTANGKTSEWKYITVWCYLHLVNNPEPSGGAMVKFEDAKTLTWSVSMESGYPENMYGVITGYSIQYSENDGATFEEFARTVTDAQTYTSPAYSMPIGHVIWRVIPLYDENTFLSIHYAEAQIIVTADPETSTVTCDGKPIPTVSWSSVAQASYQVKFGEYNSGAVYSAEKSHRVPYFFSDGVYEVTVRTQIATGEWSEWSEPVYVQITNVPPGLGITATAEPAGYRVKVVWTKNSGYVDYIVYRNGVPIHITDGGISTEGGYMDSMANGVAVYMVRGITADGYYDQSAEITVNAAVQTDILFALGSDEILPLKYTPVFPRTYNYAAEMAVTYRYFAGRSKPVAITSGQISRTLPLSYIDKGRTLARKLLSYVGKTVVFKDSGGDMIVGVLNMANAGMGHVSTTSFQITEVDYNERVEYLPGE